MNGNAGANKFTFKAHSHGHKLAHGSYELIAVPSAGGQSGAKTTVSFRVV